MEPINSTETSVRNYNYVPRDSLEEPSFRFPCPLSQFQGHIDEHQEIPFKVSYIMPLEKVARIWERFKGSLSSGRCDMRVGGDMWVYARHISQGFWKTLYQSEITVA